MVRPDIFVERMERLQEHMAILRRLQRYPLEDFLADPERYGSAERFLQLAIECLNDMGNHLIADRTLGPTEWARDIPTRLFEAGLLDKGLMEAWIRMIGFLNILVPDYIKIDRRLVHEVLHGRLDDFGRIKAALASALG